MKPGSVIAGKYRLVRRLGEGAMGAVWEAVNELTERSFAIKLIHHSALHGEELRARMFREARAAGRLQHPNVIELYDVGQTDDGDPFLVMELLRGETLEQLLERKRQLPVNLACAIGIQVARALTAAHGAGIVHRDLKPANIFLHRQPDGAVLVKVLDFGVSKLSSEQNATATSTGAAIGSPAYMSPEQAVGAPDVDGRSDLWSIGVLLLEAIGGAPAFGGDTVYAVVGNILHGPLPRLHALEPNADSRVDALVARCIVRDRAARIASARELAAELEVLLPTTAEAVLQDLDEDPTLAREPRHGGRVGHDSAIATKPYVRPIYPSETDLEGSDGRAAAAASVLLTAPPDLIRNEPAPSSRRLALPLLIGLGALIVTLTVGVGIVVLSTKSEPAVAVSAAPSPLGAPALSMSEPMIAPAPPTMGAAPSAPPEPSVTPTVSAAPTASAAPTSTPKPKPWVAPRARPTPQPAAGCPAGKAYFDAKGNMRCRP
ncbi:MAG: protein kinase [Polyangiaceae bacterium]